MKAIVHTKYGPPEVARLTEVAKPRPKSIEVLLKVHASTVNRTDSGFRSAEYFISRVLLVYFVLSLKHWAASSQVLSKKLEMMYQNSM